MAFVEWLHKGRLPRAVAGGKGAVLSDLATAGFRVPAGFSINAEGYRYFAAETGLDAKLRTLVAKTDSRDAGTARALAETAVSLISETALPDELRDQIAAAYDELCAMAGLACAVRSSAISEDGATSSFAGLYESYLNVSGVIGVLDCVRRCYASLWSERALRYRGTQSKMSDLEAMAVVVMGLVPAEVSGVAFTAHPVTGDRDVVLINAAFGLGESIVSGAVTPDSFVVAKSNFEIREREVYQKELAVYPHSDGTGTIERRLSPAEAATSSLTDDEARAVARMAVRVEAHYGPPQDIEWSMAGGRLFLLQSRPITTL